MTTPPPNASPEWIEGVLRSWARHRGVRIETVESMLAAAPIHQSICAASGDKLAFLTWFVAEWGVTQQRQSVAFGHRCRTYLASR